MTKIKEVITDKSFWSDLGVLAAWSAIACVALLAGQMFIVVIAS